jgi:hypothetical protein
LLPIKCLYLSSFSSCTACPSPFCPTLIMLHKMCCCGRQIFCETFFNIVQSYHMHRSSMHWLYDKLEMQCYVLYRIILNPLHWAGIPWRYNQNYDGMEEERCPRHNIFMCLKVYDCTLKLYWLDISASHWIIWCEVHLFSIDFIQRIMLSTNPSLCSVKSHLCWSLVVTITCTLIVSVESWSDFGPRMSISGARYF